MGAGVGAALTRGGARVITSLEGRSVESAARARAAGMQSASDADMARADFILSFVPPGDALVHPQSRAHFNALCHLGMTESSAALGQHQFTYWDYGAAFETNRGLRIDHAMLSPELAERLLSFSVDTEARAEDQPSDHAPVWVELRG